MLFVPCPAITGTTCVVVAIVVAAALAMERGACNNAEDELELWSCILPSIWSKVVHGIGKESSGSHVTRPSTTPNQLRKNLKT